ncbi:MAG: DUF5009 domain-containing protein [Candidatus Neomarinimicrobiota bacterium]
MDNSIKVSERVRSIDIFRGLTILLMIFVNDVAGVRNIPGWLKHAEPGSPGMTFVDVVFPAFLFIVGLALPYAFARREKNDPLKSLTVHILIRTAGLLAIGLLMLNGPAVTSMSAAGWNLIMYLGVILFWGSWSEKENKPGIFFILKWLGALLLIVMLVLFRRNGENGSAWIQTGWWGILGEIGFAYLISSLLYLLFRDKPLLLFIVPFFCVLLYIADRSGQLDFLGRIKDIFFIGSHFGTHVLITFSGLLCGHFLIRAKREKKRDVLMEMGPFALLLLLAGFALYGLYGIDKIAATPSWALYSSAICVVLFMLIYWISDIRGKELGYGFFKPVAVNPLLAYLLHVMFIYVFRLIGIAGFYGTELGSGIIGILRAMVYTGFIYLLTRLLTRAGLRLRL